MPRTGSTKRAAVPAGALIALFSALLSLPAAAQDRSGSTEITIFGGGYFGGTLDAGSNAIFSRDVNVDTVGTYGLRVGFNTNNWFGVEMGFSRAESHFKSQSGDALFGTSVKLGDLELRHYEMDAVFNIGHHQAIPYFVVGAGATEFRPEVAAVPNAASDWRFTSNFGGGLKMWFTPHFALRIDGRARVAYISGTDSCNNDQYCDSNNYHHHDETHWYWSGETTGGLTFAF